MLSAQILNFIHDVNGHAVHTQNEIVRTRPFKSGNEISRDPSTTDYRSGCAATSQPDARDVTYGRTKPDDMSQEEWDAWWEENGDYVKRTETEGTVTCLGPATHDVINQVLAELQDEVRTKGEEIEKLRQERFNYKDMTDAELDREYDMMLEEITRRFGPEKVRTTPRQKHP